jgi:LPXTG-site transpeptidase (sortase) family protein
MTSWTARGLRVVEYALLAVGSFSAAWCLAVLISVQYYARLPVPPAPPPGSHPLAADSAGARGEAARKQSGDWLARLDAPSLGMSAPILEGTEADVLLRGAGHIVETAFPGQRGNVGVAGHRDTIFRPLRKVRVGDELTVTTVDRVYRYRVALTGIVEPADVSVLDPTDRPVLTLVTCYPFGYIGPAPRRFIVRADFVREEPRTTAALQQ